MTENQDGRDKAVGLGNEQILYVPRKGRQSIKYTVVEEPEVCIDIVHEQRAITAENGLSYIVRLEARHFVFASFRPFGFLKEKEQAFQVERAVNHRGHREQDDVLNVKIIDGPVS